MVKTKKVKILSALLVAVTASLAIAFLSGFGKDKRVYAAELSVEGIKTDYLYNDSLAVPKAATVIIDGEEYASDSFYVVLPDGNRISSDRLVLNKCGKYSVVYEKKLGGKYYSASKEFSVKKKIFELTSGSDSVNYATLNGHFNAMGYTKGLKIGLAESDVFALNKPFNIYENNLVDLISFNCMQNDPIVCNFITLRLTDCYDPSIYMDIMYKCTKWTETAIVAGTCGGKTVGLSLDQTGNIKVDDKSYTIAANGTSVYGNNPDNGNYSNLSYYLDTSDRDKIKVYVRVGDGIADSLVAEINNDKVYQYSFKGFTDGNVFLSLRASSLVGVTEAPVELAKIGDISGEDFLTKDFYDDDLSPIFYPDDFKKEYKVAVGKEIVVPSVEVYDDYGIRGLADYVVTYEKNTAGACNIGVKNGRFVPTKKGAYTVDYIAYDVYGNKNELSFNLFAISATDGITAVIEPDSDVSAGERRKLSGIVKISSLNEDVLKTEITVTEPDGNVVSAAYDQSYFFHKVGEYSIKYKYYDIFYGGETAATVNVTANTAPKFENDYLYSNKYYIKNAEYSLFDVKAMNYTESGSNAVATKTYVSYDGGEYKEINPKKFVIEGNSTVKFKAVCSDNAAVFIESEERKIVDVGYGVDGTVEITEYFAGNMTAKIADRVPELTAATSDAYFEFVNPLSFSQFGLGYEIPLMSDGRRQSVNSMTITLTDYFNPDNKYEIVLSGKSGRYFVTLGGETYSITNEWNGASLSVKIYENIAMVGSRNIEVTNPFENDLCFMSVGFDGVKAGFKLRAEEICNQGLSTVSDTSTRVSDEVAPLVYAKLPEKVGYLGQEIVLSRPYATDVLSPSSYENLSVTVYKNGNPVKDVNGRALNGVTDFDNEVRFALGEFGKYSVIYNYTDGAGKESTPLFRIVTVVDVEAPVLVLPDEGKTINVKVGEAFAPDFEASDNVTDSARLKVYYIVKDANQNFVSTSTADIVISKAGKYTIIVYVVDQAGNGVSKSYYVNAK